ncbi:hypothetical protein NDA10_002788 [Ustilago hordei]|nr:hypothetical protein NDA10_002788 [Ustilago hordei]
MEVLLDCGSERWLAGSKAPSPPAECQVACTAESSLDRDGAMMISLGGTHVVPQGSVGDEWAILKMVESCDGEVPMLHCQAVSVALETVRVPVAKTLDGVSIGSKAGSPGGSTTVEGVASIGQGGEARSCNCLLQFQGHAGHPEDDGWVRGTFPHNLARAEEAGKGEGESCLVDLLIMGKVISSLGLVVYTPWRHL